MNLTVLGIYMQPQKFSDKKKRKKENKFSLNVNLYTFPRQMRFHALNRRIQRFQIELMLRRKSHIRNSKEDLKRKKKNVCDLRCE